MRIFVILLTTFFSLSALADGKYQQFLCESVADANSCSKQCYKQIYSRDFKINEKNSTVSQIFFKEGKQVASNVFSNCKIVDATNWDCTSYVGDTTFTNKMGNGVFVAYEETFNKNGYYPWLGPVCAKEVSLFDIFD
jgi:hypothetical protein